jgi:hypothetical protein
MAMWVYVPDRRMKPREITDMPRDKSCLVCQGFVRRVAERMDSPPYQWVPIGFICTKCNITYLGVG